MTQKPDDLNDRIKAVVDGIKGDTIKKATPPTVLIVHQSFLESVKSDLVTFILLCGSIGLGKYVDSSVLQWIAALMFLIFMFGKMKALANGTRYTIAEARTKLDELEKQFSK